MLYFNVYIGCQGETICERDLKLALYDVYVGIPMTHNMARHANRTTHGVWIFTHPAYYFSTPSFTILRSMIAWNSGITAYL